MHRTLCLLVTVTVLLGSLGAASAQTYRRHPPVTVTSTVNDLSALREAANQDRRIFAFRLRQGFNRATDGIEQKVWTGSDANGSWSAWAPRTQSSVRTESWLGSSLAAVGGEAWNGSYGLFLPRFQLFYDYRDVAGTHQLAAPSWSWLPSGYSWLSLTPPSTSYKGLSPFSGFTWKQGDVLRTNMFGLGANFTGNIIWYTSMREAWHDGSTWRFTEHGRPSDWVELLHMGPNSAVRTDSNGLGRAYVFASGNDGYEGHALFVNYLGPGCHGTATGWCWTDLGAPLGTTDMRTPVAFTYRYGGVTRVGVMVSLKRYGRWELWGRHADSERSFSAWQSFGRPPALDYTGLTRSGFDMSAGVVWSESGTLRINLFGSTTPYDVASSGLTAHGGGQLIELYWDGTGWVWGQQLSVPRPRTYEVQDQQTRNTAPRFQVMSASVVDTQAWERISVFGEDEEGQIWELFWSSATWAWKTH